MFSTSLQKFTVAFPDGGANGADNAYKGAFYDFPEIPKPKPYKDAYRARLDALHGLLARLALVRVVAGRALDDVRRLRGVSTMSAPSWSGVPPHPPPMSSMKIA